MKTKFRRRQRGIVLLVVLSLLTLFTLLMVTFIIVAGLYRQSALSAARVSRVDASPTKLLDNATFALLRDTEDPNNVIRFHSLLFDMYGVDGFIGGIRGVGNVGAFAGRPDGTGGNFFDLRINVQAPSPLPPAAPTTPGEPQDFAGTYYPLSFVDGYYNGCVLTVVSSSVAKGRSFRVVDYQAAPAASFPDPTQHVFRLMPIGVSREHSVIRPFTEDSNANGILDSGEDTNGNGKLDSDTVIVNGRPFNGTGFGYDSSGDPKLNRDYALQPNQLGVTSFASYVSGDADESYDAVDFQNMALAAIIPTTASPDGLIVIPSFHRPALVNYWFAKDKTKLPRAIMRPMPWDHPNFDGSNRELTLPPGFSATQRAQFLSKLAGVDPFDATKRINPWDVDNDGDRIPDSIWVDLGFPLQTMPDGRQVRPLFAFLCTDLDGRINLNTAGSAGQIAGLLPVNRATTLAQNAAALSLPQGQGFSPAEINPTAGSDPLFTNAQHRVMMESRYGANLRPGTNGMDAFASVKHFEFPTNYFFGTTGMAYNSPPDIFGELALGLDHRGQPVYDVPDSSRIDLLADSPYEIDVTGLQRGRADQPFTVAELERVLRFNDATARQLPDRLTNLGGIPGNDSRRRSVTTESFDVPVPAVLSLPELRSGFETTTDWTKFPFFNSGRPLHVADLLAARLVNGGVAAADINTEIAKMLSFDLRTGTPMDVNRPFGNAIDDNQNGVVDDHGYLPAFGLEAGADGVDNDGDGTTDELDEIDRLWPGLVSNLPFDHDNDPTTPPNQDGYLARHLFARHLFVLMLTLSDSDTDGNGTVNSADREFLAQWVANVVDFRDADSIMTPFEYDANPFNGWSVDGNIGTDEGGDRAIVWGCERPELLISETLAFHDRRTEDLDSDPTGKKSTDMTTPDDDFDQRLRPMGSFFIELYNPWSGETKKPAELCYDNAGNLQPGIVLNKRAPRNPGVPYLPTPGGVPLDGAPVWRLLVVGGTSHVDDLDPDHPTSGFNTNEVERGIYFADPTGLVGPLPKEHRHFSSLPIDPLVPGRFGVVGSGTPVGAGEYVTRIGRRKDAQDNGQTAGTTDLKLGTTRRISLTSGTGTSTLAHQVRVFDNVKADPAPTNIQPAIAAVINNGGRLSISEPTGGYPATNWDGTLASGEGAYSTPLDEPLDDRLLGRPQDMIDALALNPAGPGNADNRNRYTSKLRTVVLQRLANPLLPYDASFNPYRTVDRASVDLTVFEGVYDPDPGFTPPLPSPRTLAGEKFGGRERGLADSTAGDGRKLWSSIESTEPGATQLGDADDQVFNYRLEHSLGFLNGTYGSRFVSTDSVPADFYGAPKTTIGSGQPFPWLTWNNRPFVSQIELMLVPYTRSSQLLDVFGLVNSGSPYLPALKKVPGRRGQGKGKGPPGGFPPGLGRGGAAVESQFGHLLNFFATSRLGTAPPASGVSAPDLYRVFDYTYVPSRFLGTETWLNPNAFASYPIAVGSTGTELMRGPFNRVPSFREPGKINLNTLFESRVWDSVLGPNRVGPAFSGPGPQTKLADSRRGYGTAGESMLKLDANIPTFFANPFRASGAGDLVPVPEMVRPAVETTLLRSTSVEPLTALQVIGPPGVTDALFAMTGGSPHNDPNRNPYFRYQNMQRLANLVTTRSNVYAIWVTMGLFEVTIEDSGGGVYVERLGQEAGRETGSVKRHRAFYIVDRSIPVAFQPGENHNVDQAILLRRIIE